jgi:hypothetical protein
MLGSFYALLFLLGFFAGAVFGAVIAYGIAKT